MSPSCKKTIPNAVKDTTKPAWQMIAPFNGYGANFYSSTCINDSLLVVANGNVYIMANINGGNFNNFFSYFLANTDVNYQAYASPVFSGSFCSFFSNNTLNVMHIPIYNQLSTYTYIPQFTPGIFSCFQQSTSPPNNCFPAGAYPVNSGHFMITPVEGNSQTVRFDLIRLDSAQLSSQLLINGNVVVKRINLNAAPGTIGFAENSYYCASFFHKFFVNYGGQFFRIDTLGNVKAFGYNPISTNVSINFSLHNMFLYGNALFIKSGGVFYYSTDEGENWQLFNSFSGINIAILIFRNVGDKLYATNPGGNQIWRVGFNGRNLNFSEINNDGVLDYSMITSITKGSRYYFVTTYNGVYYRDSSYVDQLKSPIR
ncbi:hypothetical protein [Hydrotalea sp.]|uniref:hypothetical protein n=1 Tax=Hydrotalea sp. TaxID=2881279 RepID=UPI00261113F4|nr:hypothetical protein [Hydrotalea sp.]